MRVEKFIRTKALFYQKNFYFLFVPYIFYVIVSIWTSLNSQKVRHIKNVFLFKTPHIVAQIPCWILKFVVLRMFLILNDINFLIFWTHSPNVNRKCQVRKKLKKKRIYKAWYPCYTHWGHHEFWSSFYEWNTWGVESN